MLWFINVTKGDGFTAQTVRDLVDLSRTATPLFSRAEEYKKDPPKLTERWLDEEDILQLIESIGTLERTEEEVRGFHTHSYWLLLPEGTKMEITWRNRSSLDDLNAYLMEWFK